MEQELLQHLKDSPPDAHPDKSLGPVTDGYGRWFYPPDYTKPQAGDALPDNLAELSDEALLELTRSANRERERRRAQSEADKQATRLAQVVALRPDLTLEYMMDREAKDYGSRFVVKDGHVWRIWYNQFEPDNTTWKRVPVRAGDAPCASE